MIRNYERGREPPADVLALLKDLSPTDFESIFADALIPEVRSSNASWHALLEKVLNSGRQDAIELTKQQLMVAARYVDGRPESIAGITVRTKKVRIGGKPQGA